MEAFLISGGKMKTIASLQEESHGHSLNAGFWDEYTRPEYTEDYDMAPTPPSVAEKLCLIHSEVSEALEDYRKAKDERELRELRYEGKKPCGFPSELADIVIRVADLAERLDIDLEEVIRIKVDYNRSRGYKHGGKNL